MQPCEVEDLICVCGHKTMQHDIFKIEIAPCMVEKCPCQEFKIQSVIRKEKAPAADSSEK